MAKLTKEQLENIKFINLHTYTHFSIPMGVGNVKAHIKRAADCGHSGFAITDHYVMGGVLEAYKNLKDKDYLKKLGKEKFPLVIGCRLNIIDDLESRDRVNKYFPITAYAMDAVGYKNLVSLCSIASREDHFYVRPRISLAELIEHQEGLVVTSGDMNGMIGQAILKETGQEELLTQIFKEHFGDRFFMEVHFYNLRAQWDKDSKTYKEQETDPQKVVNLRLFELAKRHKVKCFITQNSYMPKKSDKTLQDILIGNHPFGRDGWKLSHAYYMMSVPEMYETVQKQSPYISDEQFLEFCENTQLIQNMCSNVKLSFSPRLPVIQYQESIVNKEEKWEKAFEETKKILVDEKLKELFEVAAEDISLKTSLKIMIKNEKIDFKDPIIQERLGYELGVIQRNGIIRLCDYFLLLEDVTHFVRENGYLRGFGRGCKSYGTLVLTDSGWKKIGEMVGGDKVYTHLGTLETVIKTFKYEVTESLMEVDTEHSWGPIKATSDHKVYGVKNNFLDFYPLSSFEVGDRLFLKSPSYKEITLEELGIKADGFFSYKIGQAFHGRGEDKALLSWVKDFKRSHKGLGDLVFLPKIQLRFFLDGLESDKKFKVNQEELRLAYINAGLPFGYYKKSFDQIGFLENIKDDGYFVKIKSLKQVPAEPVYDLMISNVPSYTTSNFTTHNSGAGSLVAYALDITDCDPLVFNLLFERFLTKERIGKYNFEVPGFPMNELLKGDDKKKDEAK